MRSLSFALFLGFMTAFIHSQINAEVYRYHPYSRLYIGGGFNPFEPNQGTLRCITHDGIEQVDTSYDGAVHTEAIIKMVKSRKELYEDVGFSASIGGGFLFVSGEGSMQLENESSFQSDSLSWLILFKSDYGRSVLKNPRLLPEYSNTPDDILYEKCGSEIVTEVRKGVMAYALFTVSNLTQSQKTTLNTRFKASFNSGLWSASAEADFKSFISNVAAVSNVSIKVNAIGGQGVTNLVSLLDGPGSPDVFAKYNRAPLVLSEYIKGMTPDRAVPMQFITTHLKSFVPNLGSRYSDFQTRQVAEMFNWYQDISAIVDRIRRILFQSGDREYSLSRMQRERLQSNSDEYVNAMDKIYEAAQFCFDPGQGAKCQIPAIARNLNPIIWPTPFDGTKCQQLRDFALSSRLIQNPEYEMAVNRNFAPHIVFTNDMRAYIEGWYSCEYLLSEKFDSRN